MACFFLFADQEVAVAVGRVIVDHVQGVHPDLAVDRAIDPDQGPPANEAIQEVLRKTQDPVHVVVPKGQRKTALTTIK